MNNVEPEDPRSDELSPVVSGSDAGAEAAPPEAAPEANAIPNVVLPEAVSDFPMFFAVESAAADLQNSSFQDRNIQAEDEQGYMVQRGGAGFQQMKLLAPVASLAISPDMGSDVAPTNAEVPAGAEAHAEEGLLEPPPGSRAASGSARTDFARARSAPDEQTARILRERAARAARVSSADVDEGAVLEIFVFSLSEERFALETRYVHEVLRAQAFEPIPGAPDYVVGITNLRGEVLALVDMRRLLSIRTAGLDDNAWIVVLGGEHRELGILADAVHNVQRLPRAQARTAGGIFGGDDNVVLGITADALIVLDGAALLNDPRLFIEQDQAAT